MPLLLDMIGLILHLWDSGQRPDVGDHELTYELAPLSCSIGKAGTGLKHLCPISDLFEVWAREFRVSVLSLSCMDVFCAHRHYGSAHELTHEPVCCRFRVWVSFVLQVSFALRVSFVS